MTPLPSWVRRNRTEISAGNAKLNTAMQAMKARHSKYLAMLKASGGYSVPLSSQTLTAYTLPYTVLGDSSSTAPPLVERAAEGDNKLCNQQRGAVLGEVIPIIFCRRMGGIGGVLISPPATEARFSDNAEGDITARYHLVLAEGLIGSIQVRDVFQCSCRVGTFTQTYNKRAGTFVRGNFIDNSPGLEAPNYCGTGGTYAGLSTMAYSNTTPVGFDYWNRQVHCFVRGGLQVTRILDSVAGPSNNVVDLLLYLLQAGSRVPISQIDNTSFLAAAQFTNFNGFFYNGMEDQSTNVRDWMASTLPLFLLRSSRVNGKQSLRPLLAMTNTGAIDTGPATIAFVFTEEHIVPGSFNIKYISRADRKPFCVQVLWRQQPDDDIGLTRTTDVRYVGTAPDGPFEQHDLSRFCASENHAVKVGTYILSRRKHISHRLSLRVKPDSFNPTLAPGQIVRVRLDRVASTGAASVHDYLYEVEQIGRSATGEVQLELTEFPVDANGGSVVAQEVAAAVGQGILLPTGKSGVSCDVNSSSDTTVPADTSVTGWTAEGMDADGDPYTVDWDEGGDEFEAGITPVTPSTGWYGGYGVTNPNDNLNNQTTPSTPAPVLASSGNINSPAVGDTLTTPIICEGGRIRYYRLDSAAPGGKVYLSEGPTYTMVINDVDYSVYSEIECPDPTSPTGYSEPQSSPWIGPVRDPNNSPWFYIGVPTSVALEGTFTFTETGRVWCPPVVAPNPADLSSSGDLISQSVSNVIEWRVVFLTATCVQTCGSGGVSTDTGCRIEGKRADGTTVFSNYMQGSSCNPKTAGISNTATTTRSITVVEYDGFTMNINDFFPPP